MEFVVSAARWVLRLAYLILLFPFTGILFSTRWLFCGLVNHFLLIPMFLIFRTLIYAFIYIPLLPVLRAANIKHDTLVPVEVSVFRLFTALLPHVRVFFFHFIHYFMVSLFVGSLVGIVAGINISIVSRIFKVPEARTDATRKRLSDLMPSAPDWKRVKREPRHPRIASDQSPVKSPKEDEIKETDQLSPKAPRVKFEKPEFQFPRMQELVEFCGDAIFEDDDGYNYMTYKISDERRKQAKRDNFTKPRELRQRTLPQQLQTTIEEESEPEVTPTPSHATSGVTPTNHVSLDYATGTIGSSKTFSTDSSVFSKPLGVPTADSKDENGTFRESPGIGTGARMQGTGPRPGEGNCAENTDNAENDAETAADETTGQEAAADAGWRDAQVELFDGSSIRHDDLEK